MSIVHLGNFLIPPFRHLFWLPPPLFFLKHNFDIAFTPDVSTVAIVCHDCFDYLLHIWVLQLSPLSPLVEEANGAL